MIVDTKYPVALDSRDHTHPEGTRNDNSTCFPYIEEVENYFNSEKIAYLDLGCAGGQLVIDFYNRGHDAYGLEGSDYGVVHQTCNWPRYYNKRLFTCDISRPFTLHQSGSNEIMKFDCISAWEVLEHIPEERLDCLMENIRKHLKPNGIFVGSINKSSGFYHVSAFPGSVWKETWLNTVTNCFDYPFKHTVRGHEGSLHVMLKVKTK